MAAYIISALDIHDKEKFDQVYFPAILKQVEKYGGKLLAASEKQQVVEGDWLPGRTVLWEFPDVETVQRWYQSEDYAPLLKLRLDISNGSIILITDGVTLAD